MSVKICKHCGKEFQIHGQTRLHYLQKYCSAECREQAAEERKRQKKLSRGSNNGQQVSKSQAGAAVD